MKSRTALMSRRLILKHIQECSMVVDQETRLTTKGGDQWRTKT